MTEQLIQEVYELTSEILNDNLSSENRKKLERIKEIMSDESMGSTRIKNED